MFHKAGLADRQLDPSTTESLADLLFEIGKDLHIKKQYEQAVKWLERAFEVIERQDPDKLSIDASELRTSILQCSVHALFGIQQEDAFEQARNIVSMLESEVGDKLVVLLLKLELLSVSNETFDSSAYAMVLKRIIRTAVISDSNVTLVMHHIRKLNDKSPSIACQVLDDFLQSRILAEGSQQCIESLLVNRIWMSTSQRDGQDVIASVEGILETIAANIANTITAPTAHACQMLLWKRIEANSSLGQHGAAEMWCHLALHRVFENTGEMNKAKITRKLLLCALGQQSMSSARDVFSSMSEATKEDPMTRFLMYKIAIRCDEVELASECLTKVYNASSTDATLLYACVMDAYEVRASEISVAALQLVLEKYDHNIPSTIHLPALLRVTIRLINSRLEQDDSISEADAATAASGLCKLFEGGL
jgi:hypothetical protein